MKVNASSAFISLHGRNENNQRNNVDGEQAIVKIQPVNRKRDPNNDCHCHDDQFESAVRPRLRLKILGCPPDEHAVYGLFALEIMRTVRAEEFEYDNRKKDDRSQNVGNHPKR
jgi:hypothetical protein